jgi:hypothetical protein
MTRTRNPDCFIMIQEKVQNNQQASTQTITMQYLPVKAT